MSKILVTGSSGFIGSYLTKYLQNQGYHILGIDKELPIEKEQKQEIFIKCDILNKDHLEKIVKDFSPTTILHLAARTDLNEKQDIQGYASNMQGVKNIIDAIRQTPRVKRCIFTSSQLVCRIGYVPKNEYEYNPNTLYGESKVLTEKIVREGDGGGVEWCLVRPTTVWGPGMTPHYQKFLKMIQQGRYFHVGKKPLYKSYSYIGNISYQYQKLMEAPTEQVHRKTFYLADYEPISLRNWTNLIKEELRAEPIPTYPEYIAKLAAKMGDAINWFGFKKFPFNSFRLNNILTEYIFDISETQKICGTLPYTTEQGVKELVNWLKNEVFI